MPKKHLSARPFYLLEIAQTLELLPAEGLEPTLLETVDPMTQRKDVLEKLWELGIL